MPYATIIIPTFDRHATLPFVVRSLQAQTAHDIEILIAGDGCTPEVRAVAEGFASSDSRVTFRDMPKAPMRGAANRDLAVRAAKAERIFYSDDDDLMLPNHVETLGAALDHADIVDTPVMSIRLYGPPALGILNSGHPLQRELLVSERLKGVFDTHLVHTKKVYLDRAPAWSAPPDRRVVLHMLKAFAGDASVRWLTLQRITACSLHGARRLNASTQVRASELADLLSRMSQNFESSARLEGGYCAYALPLLKVLDPSPTDIASLFATLGIPLSGVTQIQADAVNALIDAWQGRKPSPEAAGAALLELLEPLHAPVYRIPDALNPFAKTLGAANALTILNNLPDQPPVLLARAHLFLQSRNLIEAQAAMGAALAIAPDQDRLAIGLAFAESLSAAGYYDQAWDWTTGAVPTVPDSFQLTRFWKLRATLAARRMAADEQALATARLKSLETSET